MPRDDPKVNSVRVSVIVHATEATGKVRQALSFVCSIDTFPWKIEKKRVRGHHGNEILTMGLTLRGAPSAIFFENLWRRLRRIDQELVLSSLDTYVDESGKLHLRLSKQEALRGNLQIQDADPVKVEASFLDFGRSGSHLVPRIRKRLESMIS